MSPRPTLETIRVDPGRARERPYTVFLGVDLPTTLASHLSSSPLGDRYALITDRRVLPLHGKGLADRLRRSGLRVDVLSFPPGEDRKNRRTRAFLEDRLVNLGLGRDGAILALGGGVVGDLAGFVAATYHRGIPYVQIPTTLLAMVDASVGGKTGHDLPGGKNLVGAFHHPAAVYVDLSVLRTLPAASLRAGFAEVIKHGLVADPDLTAFLEQQAGDLLALGAGSVRKAVSQSIRIKSRVVSKDAREVGMRAVLNFGHTVGHALEAASGYGISHGQAVAMGMVAEAELSSLRGLLAPASVDRIRRLLEAFELPVTIPASLARESILAACSRDKKVREGVVRCVLLRGMGEVARAGGAWTTPVSVEEISHALERCVMPVG